ncbi:hypothetical protein [Tsuneonella sp. SYSU-LHT278]|uniref:hypothetical protein n=1 Tax=Tsuneonella sediminis TaxID=3416089 RepID=UPI003F7AD609
MRKTTIAAAVVLTFAATPAHAEYWDVISFQLKDDCPIGKYMAIVKDFNEWGKTQGYTASILTPVQNNDQSLMYWIGKTRNAATFGSAWDAWRDAQPDSASTAARLQARFTACSVNKSRSGFDAW